MTSTLSRSGLASVLHPTSAPAANRPGARPNGAGLSVSVWDRQLGRYRTVNLNNAEDPLRPAALHILEHEWGIARLNHDPPTSRDDEHSVVLHESR